MADVAVRPDVAVLTYHSIDGSGSPVSLAPAEFRRQMTALSAAGWRTLTAAEFVRGYRDGGWPARTFLLTFDDGYRNLLEEALPITAACAFAGVVFVATDRVGGVMAGPGEPSWTPASPLLDWAGIRALTAAGWAVGSHACSHRRLPGLPADAVSRELSASKAAIEREIGAAAVMFAYPYGAATPAVERLVGEHYDAAFGTGLAHATRSSRATNFDRIDAYYLRNRAVASLDGGAMRAYLRVRRAGRGLRGLVSGG